MIKIVIKRIPIKDIDLQVIDFDFNSIPDKLKDEDLPDGYSPLLQAASYCIDKNHLIIIIPCAPTGESNDEGMPSFHSIN